MMETDNKYIVGVRGKDIVVLVPPWKMNKEEALLFAAWIVALADDNAGEQDSEFNKTLDAVLGI